MHTLISAYTNIIKGNKKTESRRSARMLEFGIQEYVTYFQGTYA